MGAHLNKPTTLGTGMTVCPACVEKYNGLVDSKNAFATAFDVLNFGKNINVTLSSISKNACKNHILLQKNVRKEITVSEKKNIKKQLICTRRLLRIVQKT